MGPELGFQLSGDGLMFGLNLASWSGFVEAVKAALVFGEVRAIAKISEILVFLNCSRKKTYEPGVTINRTSELISSLSQCLVETRWRPLLVGCPAFQVICSLLATVSPAASPAVGMANST